MKKIIVAITILFLTISVAKGQAHIGYTEFQIKNMYPQKKWTFDYTEKDGTKYISTDMNYGNFTYYLSKKTGLCYFCIQIPFNIATMNGQIEAYNKKYVITSERTWTAYLDEGAIMYITLTYDEENKLSYFEYSGTK